MRRYQARRSSGRFTRNTTENTFGFHTVVCAACRRFNTWDVGAARPAMCHACGEVLRDEGAPLYPSPCCGVESVIVTSTSTRNTLRCGQCGLEWKA